MPTQNTLKLLRSLQQKKYRLQHRLFVCEGIKLVNELLHSKFTIHSLYHTAAWQPPTSETKKNFSICPVSHEWMERASAFESASPVMAVVHAPDVETIPGMSGGFHLALDAVRDPGNLGTIIRTAEWFGIHSVICSKDCAELFNPKTVQAAMGSLFRIKIFYTGLEDFFSQLKLNRETCIYGAVMDGKPPASIKLKTDAILLLGNEANGIQQSLIRYIDIPLTIVPAGNSKADSLNVSAAAAAFCYEFSRQFQRS